MIATIVLALAATAPAGAVERAAVELIRPPAPTLYDHSLAQPLDSGRLTYGAALTLPNPITASTLADNRALSALHIDAAAAERGQISAVVKAVQNAPVAVIGRFASARDPFLKPKLDEGLLGAILDKAPSLKETLRFLRRVYVPPLGERSVGPSDVTVYLSHEEEFIRRINAAVVGGVSIGDARGVAAIGSIVKAKARGLRLVHVDSRGIAQSLGAEPGGVEHAAALAKVENAARGAGIPLSGEAASRQEALAMHARGYAHVIIGDDASAVDAGFAAYADAPRDPAKEPPLPPPAGAGNAVKTWLDAGQVGTLGFLMSPDDALARRMTRQANGLWIDGEDGQFPLTRIRELIAGAPRGAPVVVRTTQFDNPDVAAYVQAGAAGVVAPQVSTAWQARRFVETVKGASPNALAVVMIETKRGLENVEEIARLPGVDVLFIGPHDLALSLGVAPESAAFAAALARIEAAARACGVPLGGLAKTRSQAYRLREKGYGLLTTVSDQGAVAAYFKKLLAAVLPRP